VLWIRIRIDLAVLDPNPDPYWECESGTGSRRMEINQNYQINLVSCLSRRSRKNALKVKFLTVNFETEKNIIVTLFLPKIDRVAVN
jgi:hypothetical protein